MAILKGFDVSLSINGEIHPGFELAVEEPTPSTPTRRRSARLEGGQSPSQTETTSTWDSPVECGGSRYNLRPNPKGTKPRMALLPSNFPQLNKAPSCRIDEQQDIPGDRKCTYFVEATPGANFAVNFMFSTDLNGGKRFSYPGVVANITVDGLRAGCQCASKPGFEGCFNGRSFFSGNDYYEEPFRFSEIKFGMFPSSIRSNRISFAFHRQQSNSERRRGGIGRPEIR